MNFDHQNENAMANDRALSKRAMRIAAIEGEVGSNDRAKGIVRVNVGGKMEHLMKHRYWSILTPVTALGPKSLTGYS